MSVKCPQCGLENQSGKFCAQCGAPLTGPASSGGNGWVKWAVAGVAVLALIVVGFKLLGNKPPSTPTAGPSSPSRPADNPDTPSKPPAQPPAQQLGNSQAKVSVKLVGEGSLGERSESYSAVGQFLGSAKGTTAALWKFDAAGAAKRLGQVDDTDAGQLLNITVGDLLNADSPGMVAIYEKKLYVLGQSGKASPMENAGVYKVLVGDYDGDSKNETIFLKKTGETYGFEVWRYDSSGNKELYSKAGRQEPWPDLFQTTQKAGDVNLLFGYVWEGSDLFCVLYKWDGIGGPTEISRYPVPTSDDAQAKWIASGPTGAGPTVAITRTGTKNTVEMLVISKDAKSLTSQGSMTSDGTGWPALMISNFVSSDGQLLAVDETGSYQLYSVIPK